MKQKTVTSQQLNKWAEEAYKNAIAKGFWEGNFHIRKASMLMLIISELTEAIENERKEKPLRADLNYFESEIDFYRNEPDEKVKTAMYCTKFISIMKDSTEDELADSIIRILDFCSGFNHRIAIEQYPRSAGMEETTRKENPFYEQLFIVTAKIAMYPLNPKSWYRYEETEICAAASMNRALNDLLFIAEWREIDIAKHIEYKIRFNATRPYLHGKTF